MKKTLIVSLSLLATIALADGLLVGLNGKGRLTTSDGRNGLFNYDVSKRIASSGTFKIAGNLRFEQQPNSAGPYVLIELGTPATLATKSNVCEFGCFPRPFSGREGPDLRERGFFGLGELVVYSKPVK